MTFDLRTHVRNAKGDIIQKQPYKVKIKDGLSLFERPVGSGNWFDMQGTLIHKGEDAKPKAQAKPEFDINELEQMLAEAKAKLEASKAPEAVEPKPKVLTQSAPGAQAKEVPKPK